MIETQISLHKQIMLYGKPYAIYYKKNLNMKNPGSERHILRTAPRGHSDREDQDTC